LGRGFSIIGARARAAAIKSTPMGLACSVQSLEMAVERMDQSHKNPNRPITLCRLSIPWWSALIGKYERELNLLCLLAI